MQFGNLSGLINGTEQVVFDYEVSGSAVSSISTGNILNGDEDGEYLLIFRMIGTASNLCGTLYLNNDTNSANYGIRAISSTGSTVANYSPATTTGAYFPTTNVNNGNTGFAIGRLYAKSGSVRLLNIISAGNISGTTVSQLYTQGSVWTNTVDNLINITLAGLGGSNGLGVGTRFTILKMNNFSNGTSTGTIKTPYIKGAWTRIASSTLGSRATTILNVTGLDGDRDVMYRIIIGGRVTGGTGGTAIRFNGDSGSNYGYQFLVGDNTSVIGAQGSFSFVRTGYAANGADQNFMNEFIVFSKKGFVRPGICTSVTGINGTTINEIVISGQVWSNTADAINAILVYTDSPNFEVGTTCDIYALRPNG